MRFHFIFAVALFTPMFSPVSAFAADKPAYSIEIAEKAPPKALKKEIAELLESKCVKVLDSNAKVYCEIWFRKAMPAKAEEEQIKNGLTYRELEMTGILAAVEFPQKVKDYRDQEVKAGVYTLRLAIQPMDGDHMGTAPYNEFVILVAAEKDEKPDPMEPKSLIDLGAKSLESAHPGILLLFPHAKPENEPKIADKGMGHWVLFRKLDVSVGGKAAAIGIGLTVIGKSAAVGS